uniref:Saposin B-type domain-containing protein n=1 Tax=Panagrolaimus superbus TaxID=310955 RepID=A0A914Z4D7_9BILA
MKLIVVISTVIFVAGICSGKVLLKEEKEDDSMTEKICEMCVSLITKATTQIIEHEDDFKQNGGKICDVVTLGNDELDKKCHEIITDKVDDIIKLVRDETAPKDVCSTISVCPAQ